MKRFCFVMAVLLVFSLNVAYGEGALDAAFESGSITLVETENAGFDLSACEIVIPDGFWAYNGMEKPTDAELAGMISTMLPQAEVFSVSPAGNSALIVSDNVVFGLNGATITALWPNEERGVADDYGNMKKFYTSGMRRLLDYEGIVWSHDGRYAVLTSSWKVIFGGNPYFIDPMLIDTVTGDIFLTATYPNKIVDDLGGDPIGACFSSDDQYLYYTFRGNLGENRNGGIIHYGLFRYDLTTEETELLYKGNTEIYYPKLSELNDGSLVVIADTRSLSESMGVARLAPGSQSAFWKLVPENVTSQLQTAGQWNIGVRYYSLPSGQWKTYHMEYSAASDYAITMGYFAFDSWGLRGLQVFRSEDDFGGIDTYWVLKADTLEFLSIPGGGFEQIFVKSEDGDYKALVDGYLSTYIARLSPDGCYALIEAGHVTKNRNQLLLVRLEDMKTVPVQGIDSNALLPFYSNLTTDYRPGIEWNGDQLLILVDGEVKSYRIDTGD